MQNYVRNTIKKKKEVGISPKAAECIIVEPFNN